LGWGRTRGGSGGRGGVDDGLAIGTNRHLREIRRMYWANTSSKRTR
jgi:hypothetical protein